MIETLTRTLQKANMILKHLSDKELSDVSVAPYYSSAGSHIRHILDFYDCIFNLNSDNTIDLTARSRNKDVESKCDCAKNYLNVIIEKLNDADFDINEEVKVIDDLGLGKVKLSYTFGAVLAQANSHTIHHYAIINYILKGLNIHFNNTDFGYNPTTPKTITLN